MINTRPGSRAELCLAGLAMACFCLLLTAAPARAEGERLVLRIEQVAQCEPTKDLADRRSSILNSLRKAKGEMARGRWERKLARHQSRIDEETGLFIRGIAQFIGGDGTLPLHGPFNVGLVFGGDDHSADGFAVGDLMTVERHHFIGLVESLVTVRYYSASTATSLAQEPTSWSGRPPDLVAPWCETPPDSFSDRRVSFRQQRDAEKVDDRTKRHFHFSWHKEEHVGSSTAQVFWYTRAGNPVGPFDMSIDRLANGDAFTCVNISVTASESSGANRPRVRVCHTCPLCWNEPDTEGEPAVGEEQDGAGGKGTCKGCGQVPETPAPVIAKGNSSKSLSPRGRGGSGGGGGGGGG